jgi:hypothetical protein
MDELKNKRVLVAGDRSAPHLVIGPLQVRVPPKPWSPLIRLPPLPFPLVHQPPFSVLHARPHALSCVARKDAVL